MTIDLYYGPGGSGSRTVLLAAKVIGVDLNLKPINVVDEEVSVGLLQINPQHTVPTLNDNGFVVLEEKPIVKYLQEKYGKHESLYPRDPEKRAVVDQRLEFDTEFYKCGHEVYNQKTFKGAAPSPESVENLKKAVESLNNFLESFEYVAGDNVTLADLALTVEVSNLEVLKYDLTPFQNINKWYAKMKATIPGYKEANEDQLEIVKQTVEKFSKTE